jgi:protein subunit release factor A
LDEVDVLLYRATSDDDPAAMGVRLVHKVTGIVVESVTEPSQVANRDIALRLLREQLRERS